MDAPEIYDPSANLSRRHPFDIEHGIDTSGYIPPQELTDDENLIPKISSYSGTHPSIIRRIIGCLPTALNEYTFYDLGCGKGRPLFVASEFSFQRIVGIELFQNLADIAKANAKIVAGKYPERPPIEIIQKSVADLKSFTSKAVLFLYNPFDQAFMQELADSIVSQLAQGLEHVFIIYHNPYWGQVFDNCPDLTRWCAKQFTCDPSELDYGYSSEGATIVWQSRKNAFPTPHEQADRGIIKSGEKAADLA